MSYATHLRVAREVAAGHVGHLFLDGPPTQRAAQRAPRRPWRGVRLGRRLATRLERGEQALVKAEVDPEALTQLHHRPYTIHKHSAFSIRTDRLAQKFTTQTTRTLERSKGLTDT